MIHSANEFEVRAPHRTRCTCKLVKARQASNLHLKQVRFLSCFKLGKDIRAHLQASSWHLPMPYVTHGSPWYGSHKPDVN